jgi:hypothetical protein
MNKRVLTIMYVMGATLPMTVAASAHDWTNWINQRWETATVGTINQDRHPQWNFVKDFPSGDGGRSVVINGAHEWNNLNKTLTFDYDDAHGDYDTLNFDNCSDNYQADKVGWGVIGASGWVITEAAAQTATCNISGYSALYDFKIKFNQDAPWYKGTSTVPTSAVDMWSVAAHEFGHATGRDTGNVANGDGNGHFTEGSSYCPKDSTRHTMCPATVMGTTWSRSLAPHDVDVFTGAYG